MIDVISVAAGVVSKTPIRSRQTKLQAVDTDCLFHLETIKENQILSCIAYKNELFLDLVAVLPANTDLTMFVSFETNTVDREDYSVYTMSSVVEDISYCKYQITIKQSFFEKLNIVQYRRSISKLIKAITGV